MSAELRVSFGRTAGRYEELPRIFEALCACSEPEEVARVLADHLEGVVHFDHLDVVVLKENSNEIEWHAWGKGQVPLPWEGGAEPVPNLEELPIWRFYTSQEPIHIADWNNDERSRPLRESLSAAGVDIGSVICVPLATSHRRLGTLGIASRPGITYSAEEFAFVRLIALVVAFAIDDGLHLRRAQAARAELEGQNDRLQLLLNLSNRITSNLELRELLRAMSANIREVVQADAVVVSLLEAASGKFRIFALDFPDSKGVIKEELLVTPSAAVKKAMYTLKPVVFDTRECDELAPEPYGVAAAEGVRAACSIPLVNRGRFLGILSILRTIETSFTPDDVDFLSRATGQIAVAIENALAYREISELKDKLAQEKLYLEEEIRSEMSFEHIVGNSAAIRSVLELVETVASSDSTVLLLGETGTGKELIARALHDHSRRKDRTFVKLNCAAIPTGLFESELFGHEKGAFTGAIAQKIGRLELADHGTLFLDEVGDVPLEIQPKLLRALQEREFERLGSTRTKKVDVRLVAATNRDLESMIAAREFRSDLYYRLNVFPIRIPPLRERREDIPLLARYFAQKFARQMQKQIETIQAAAMKTLTDWDWPGNIRELGNFIERAVILTRGRSLEVPLTEFHQASIDAPIGNLGPRGREEIVRIVRETISEMNDESPKGAAGESDERRRQEIIDALRESKGRVGGAGGVAARLGINRTTLLSRMKKLGIDPKQFS
jgi:formate hydrogenlyase transcriptional activator